MSDNLKALRKRAATANQKRDLWGKQLQEVYDYVIPYRSAGISATSGQNLTDKVFDATAIDAAFRFAGRMQQELTPPFQKFFELFAGPGLTRDATQKKQIDEELASIGDQVSAALSTSAFHLASAEMYLDLFASTGAMLMLEGDARQPIRVFSVPIGELAMELGPWGDIWGRYWTRSWEARQIAEMWPKGTFGEALANAIKSEDDKKFSICQATVWNPERRRWVLSVFEIASAQSGKAENESPQIFTEEYRSSPWITPRFYVVPGEAMGRGPGMLMLPFVKTTNKAVELELQAAALALFGVWTARDDNVFNVNTARFEPGAFWKVSSNAGGAMGPSLQKLDVPGKFDLSRIIVENERAQINHMGFNRRLPPITGAVRSPTEILERIHDLDIDLGGVYGRMAMEVVHPSVQRAIEILENLKVLETKLTIDQLNIGIKVTSPIANAQKTAKSKTTVDYMQIVQAFVGQPGLAAQVRLETALGKLGRNMGVDEEDLRSGDESKMVTQQIMDQAAQIVAEEQLKNAPPAAAPEEPTAQEMALQ